MKYLALILAMATAQSAYAKEYIKCIFDGQVYEVDFTGKKKGRMTAVAPYATQMIIGGMVYTFSTGVPCVIVRKK